MLDMHAVEQHIPSYQVGDFCKSDHGTVDHASHVTLEVGANLWLMVACVVLSGMSFLVSIITLLVIALRT